MYILQVINHILNNSEKIFNRQQINDFLFFTEFTKYILTLFFEYKTSFHQTEKLGLNIMIQINNMFIFNIQAIMRNQLHSKVK